MDLLFTYLKNIMHWKLKKIYWFTIQRLETQYQKKITFVHISTDLLRRAWRFADADVPVQSRNKFQILLTQCLARRWQPIVDKFYKVLLGWPNCSFGFFHNMEKLEWTFGLTQYFYAFTVYTLSLAMPQGSVITFTTSWRHSKVSLFVHFWVLFCFVCLF